MINEAIFIIQSITVALFACGAILFGSGCLYAFTALCWVLGNLFVLKEATLFSLDVITSDAFAVGANIGVTLLREYYGEKEAEKAIYTGIYMALFFLCTSQLLLWYAPNMHDCAHPHFLALFERMPRIVISSFGVALISMTMNLALFNLFNKIYKFSFHFSSMASLSIAQFLDTALFGFIALSGNVASLTNIICFSYLVKVISIAIAIPLISVFHHFIPKKVV